MLYEVTLYVRQGRSTPTVTLAVEANTPWAAEAEARRRLQVANHAPPAVRSAGIVARPVPHTRKKG